MSAGWPDTSRAANAERRPPAAIAKRHKGRAKGCVNKFSSDMRWATLEVFRQLGGIAWLKAQAEEYPVEFMHLLGKLLPKPVTLDVEEGSRLDQLLEQVQNAGKPTPADLQALRSLS